MTTGNREKGEKSKGERVKATESARKRELHEDREQAGREESLERDAEERGERQDEGSVTRQ